MNNIFLVMNTNEWYLFLLFFLLIILLIFFSELALKKKMWPNHINRRIMHITVGIAVSLSPHIFTSSLKPCLLALIFFTINLTAQTSYDTVYFSGEQFVEHFVKGGESLKKIAKLHNVKTSEIKDANELNKRLYYNQLLYIPIYLNKVDEKPISVNSLVLEKKNNLDPSVVNLAILMPYYLVKNDTMFNNYDDILDIPSIYYKKSEIALSFHVGFELAVDSLRKAGKKIVLHTFDTNNDTLEVRKIIYSNKLDKMDKLSSDVIEKQLSELGHSSEVITKIQTVLGIKDIVAKSLGTANPHNVIRACLKALLKQNSPKNLSILRNKKISEIIEKRG